MVYRYPPEVHEFVRTHCTEMRDQELAEACNRELGTQFTRSSIKAFRGNHGYTNHMSTHWSSEEYWKFQSKWPKGMYEFIRDNSWGVSSAKMAEIVNAKFGTEFTPHRMKCFRARHKIKSGVSGWYQKGHSPGNKGKKQSEYCSPEALERSRQTQFKKGQVPPNQMPVGAVVVNSQGYKLRKKQMEGDLWDRWEFLHRAIWEEHNGPVPKGMHISFRDNNRLNCDIENLMLVTQGENAALTRLHYRFEDPELTDAALQVVRLRQKAEKVRKERRKKKQND